MGIRAILALLLLLALSLATGFIYALLAFSRSRLFEIFPSDLLPQANDALQVLMVQGVVAFGVFAGLLTIIIFVILSGLIVRPLKSILISMKAFAETGERVDIGDLVGTPKEIRTLANVFERFVDKVEQVHKHDMEISRVKSDFISTAAHQLRTPLTGIRWALEALDKENLTESQKALVTSAKDKSHDLVETVKTLLDISAIESGKHKYEFERVDLSPLLREVAQDFSPMATEAKVSLFYVGTQAALPLVRVDQSRIKWILNNLIENAVRYTPAGGTVTVSAEVSGQRLLVRVRDTGIGIAAEDRGNIFERFYRAPNAITKENQGNGLGLYIARTIAVDHGGDLDFMPNPDGAGTTFVLSLPLAL